MDLQSPKARHKQNPGNQPLRRAMGFTWLPPRSTAGLLALMLAAGAPACKRDSKADEAAAAAASAKAAEAAFVVSIEFRPSAAQQAVLTDLKQKPTKAHWSFDNKAVNKRANAQLFTYLAATERDEPTVGAALRAMHVAFSTHSKRKAQPDADYQAVVEHYLKSDNPRLVARALLAARTAISGKNGVAALIEPVLTVAERFPDGPGRYAVLDALQVVSASKRTEPIMEVFTDSLNSKHPYVVSSALQALFRSLRTITDKPALKETALGLAEAENPGVRGRALELLGAIGDGDPKVVDVALKSLDDPHPYVRSQACSALSRLRYKPAVHKMMGLLEDESRNRFDIRDWTTLDEQPGRVHHDGSAWSYVFDAAMVGIRSLSGGALKFERVRQNEVKQDLARNVAVTKAWYASAKSSIPTR